MNTKNVTLRCTHDILEYLSKNYKNISSGIIDAIEALQAIRLYSTNELKSLFTKEEWAFFVDSLNGTIVEKNFRCNANALIAHCEDAENLEGTASKHGVDLNILIEKIKILSGAQLEALYFRIELFWNNDKKELEEFCNF